MESGVSPSVVIHKSGPHPLLDGGCALGHSGLNDQPGRTERSVLEHLKSQWEDLCTQCGVCCYERERVCGELQIHEGAPCSFLDTETKLCTVYDTRLKTCKECRQVTVFHALFSPYLPNSCGYVQTFRIWKRSSKFRPEVQTEIERTP